MARDDICYMRQWTWCFQARSVAAVQLIMYGNVTLSLRPDTCNLRAARDEEPRRVSRYDNNK